MASPNDAAGRYIDIDVHRLARAHRRSLGTSLFVGILAVVASASAIACSGSDDAAIPTTASNDSNGDGGKNPSTGSAEAGQPPTSGTSDGGQDAVAPSSPCASGALCVDFETGTPSPQAITPNCSGTGALSLDSAVAHGGTGSLRVDGAGGYCNHVFWSAGADALSRFGDSVHVRFFVRFESALGDSHVTFLATQDSGPKKDLRMGGQNAILMWNRESDDATLPDLSPQGSAKSVKPSTATWHCVEITLTNSAGSIATSVDGSVVVGLGTGGSDSPWSKSPAAFAVTDLRLGWESYGGTAAKLWFDDLVVSDKPIGCGP